MLPFVTLAEHFILKLKIKLTIKFKTLKVVRLAKHV